MKLTLYNTLTRQQEEFIPLDPNGIKMYVCGPTVYDRPHIGNARSVVVYDLLYRLLINIYQKDHVKYVRNITDVDDKIIDRANLEKISIKDLTDKTTDDFHHDVDYLHCLRPTIEPRATEHITEMLDIITLLLDKNIAYIAENDVYFDITKSENYTKLSGRSVEEMFEGVRVENSIAKKNPQDFVLWKSANRDDIAGSNFPSPFGLGRPGWHIECSAMVYKHLGKDFDIHGGGADLIFPHHTNEIAQSSAAFPGHNFARYWVHNGFLTVNKAKMSKSLGNFITVEDLINMNISGDVLRLFLLSSHYRKPLDYNEKAISDAKKTIEYWRRALNEFTDVSTSNNETSYNIPHDFLEPLYDDLNTPKAISFINSLAAKIFSSQDPLKKNEHINQLRFCLNIAGIKMSSNNIDDINKVHLTNLLIRRTDAKNSKNWIEADNVRDEIIKLGFVIEDKKDGSVLILDRSGTIVLQHSFKPDIQD